MSKAEVKLEMQDFLLPRARSIYKNELRNYYQHSFMPNFFRAYVREVKVLKMIGHCHLLNSYCSKYKFYQYFGPCGEKNNNHASKLAYWSYLG